LCGVGEDAFPSVNSARFVAQKVIFSWQGKIIKSTAGLPDKLHCSSLAPRASPSMREGPFPPQCRAAGRIVASAGFYVIGEDRTPGVQAAKRTL